MSYVSQYIIYHIFVQILCQSMLNAQAHPSFRSLTTNNGLAQNTVNSIFQDSKGFIWLGTQDGLNRYDGYDFITFRHDASDTTSISHNWIWDIHEDRNGNLWIATQHGLNRLTPGNTVFKRYLPESDHNNSIAGNQPTTLCEDKYGNLWIGTWASGLNLFDPTKETFTHFRHKADEANSLISDSVRALYSDFNENLWVGTRNGLSKMDISDLRKPRFTHYYPNASKNHSIPSEQITSIIADKDGNVWISSYEGELYRWDAQSKLIATFNYNDSRDYTSKPNISSLMIDNKGRLWIGMVSQGISIIDLKTNKRTHVKHVAVDRHSLLANDINCLFMDQSGLIWIGAGGINIYNSRVNQFAPPIHLTAFNVFNSPYFKTTSLPMRTHIKLSHKQNFLSFEFSALDFAQPANNKYQYKLEGLEKSWILAEERRYAGYTNLNPGQYTFKVKGTNSNGDWSPHEASIKIRITPAFWQTIWIKLIVIICIVTILWLTYQYRKNRLQELERLRISIASDLHDEVGASLTRISIHSEQIQNTNDKNVIIEASRKIGSISREVITTMSDIVWSIDTRNDTIGDLLNRMYDFAYSTLSINDITIVISDKGFDKTKKININNRQNIYYIFKEAVNNILKYAKASEANITLKNDEKYFGMEIKDNGVGFNIAKVKKGNGLKNMQMRARRIDGQLSIRSDDGTKIVLKTKKL